MGLDISAYRHLTRREEPQTDDERASAWEAAMRVTNNPDFPGRGDGLEDGFYDYREEMDFRAGSYSGYNQWREELAKLAGYKPLTNGPDYEPARPKPYSCGAWSQTSGPFWELIHFSDCEGTIGPATSLKLAKDFAEFQTKADAHADAWFREAYADWRKAFEMASDNGAVCFH